MKVCTRCNELKSMQDYYIDRAKIDGRKNVCIECSAEMYSGKKAQQINVLLRRWKPA